MARLLAEEGRGRRGRGELGGGGEDTGRRGRERGIVGGKGRKNGREIKEKGEMKRE